MIASDSGSNLVGWWLAAAEPRGAILLLHGLRSNREDMMGLARFFHAAHYHVLAIDLQAHGESPGEHITFGHLESLDAAAAVNFLWEIYPDGPVFVMGRSLGGAAAILADYERPPTAIIAEAVFKDLETAIGNRIAMRLGDWSRVLAPFLSWQVRPRLGVSIDALSPELAITRQTMPILIIYGSQDEHARPEEAQALIAAAGGPVESFKVEGADHNSISRVDTAAYLLRIQSFCEQHRSENQ